MTVINTTTPSVVKRENPTKFAPITQSPSTTSNKEFLKPYNVLSFLIQEEDAFATSHRKFNQDLAAMAWYPKPAEVTGTTQATDEEIEARKVYLNPIETSDTDELVFPIPSQDTAALIHILLGKRSHAAIEGNSLPQAASSSSHDETSTGTKKVKTKEEEPLASSSSKATLPSCKLQ